MPNSTTSERNFIAWTVCLTILFVFAVISTVYRIYRRRKTGQLWWDDYVAALCLFLDCFYFSTLWSQASDRRDEMVTVTLIRQILYPLVLWGTRVSLSVSMFRVIPPQQHMRKASMYCGVVCGIMGISFSMWRIIACSKNENGWKDNYPYQCLMPTSAAIFRIVADILSDLALILIPFWAFWHNLRLQNTTRRLIQACFTAGMVMILTNSAMSVLYFVRQYSPSPATKAQLAFTIAMTSHLLLLVSLLACNVLIVATSIYRRFRTKEIILEMGNPQPAANAQPTVPTMTLTSPRHESGLFTSAPSIDESIPTNVTSSTPITLTRNSTDMGSEIVLTELFDSDFTGHTQTNSSAQNDSGRRVKITSPSL